jgi:hypothetical protein
MPKKSIFVKFFERLKISNYSAKATFIRNHRGLLTTRLIAGQSKQTEK